MKPYDMLRLSVGNLFKRKLRTILTVLGVTIGVASIVVMISLGLGLSRSFTEDMSNYASLTSVMVRDASQGGRMSDTSEDSENKKEKHLNDEAVAELMKLENVTNVSPILTADAYAKSGSWEAYLTVNGVPEGYLERQNVKIAAGEYPQKTGSQPRFFYGNMILAQFMNSKTESGYWWDGTVPDIDLANDALMVIFDTERYFAFQNNTPDENGAPPQAPKKYLIEPAGVEEGGLDDYNSYAYDVYCNIDDLKMLLKKEFKNRTIPGQPVRKNGKPYKEIFYSQLIVETDSMENVQQLQTTINEMGYNASSDAEWIEQEQKTMNMIQLVLGGIGAVSLFVAAIGITNTMMMSIYERTKEIGIMKVLGCDMRNIQGLFLIEAGFIGLIGGITGLIISYIISIVINSVAATSELMDMGTSKLSVIPLWLAVLSVLFAIFVGMIAGFFPSLRAMRLSPLAAIRNE